MGQDRPGMSRDWGLSTTAGARPHGLPLGRMLRRANLVEIQKGIEIWNTRVKQLSRTSQGRSAAVTLRPNF